MWTHLRLKVDQQDRESMPHQQLRPRDHGRPIRAHSVQQQHHRRLASPVHPPPRNGVPGAGDGDALRLESRRQ
jgi:hypothetical protein